MKKVVEPNPTLYGIRTQKPDDLPALTELVAKAFAADRTWGNRRNLTEIAVPAGMAALPSFDPEIALVAEDEAGAILGYALFYPYTMRLRGRRIRAACLAPLAVDPDHGGKGIGSVLMHASRKALEAKGFSLAFLCGHEGYYPRFGYLKGMFGRVGLVPRALKVTASRAPLEPEALRAPRPGDEGALLRLWENCHGDSDLALEPEKGFAGWMSWTPQNLALVLERQGEVVAYARFVNAEAVGAFGGGGEPRATAFHLFLAADAETANEFLTALQAFPVKPAHGAEAKTPLIPIHPGSAAAARLFPAGYERVLEKGGYAMALPLAGGGDEEVAAARDYCEGVAAGRLDPGLLILPPVFDLE